MNDKLTNIPDPDDEAIARKLNQVAEQTHASGQFAAALEEKLRSAHKPKTGWFSQLSPVLPWAAVILVLGLILSWSIKSLVPVPQPSGNVTPNGFACPVTQPNGSLPPGTQSSPTTDDPDLYGNGELWTVLQPDGKVLLSPENQRADGTYAVTWPWYLGTEGQLTIEGKQLDAQAEPLKYELSEPFNNFQGSTLIFPATGCWQITGHAGNASLTFITEVMLASGIATPTPITTPNVVLSGTATVPVVQEGGYDWRQTKLYLNVPLPQSPAQANVYSLDEDQPATVDMALTIASQFGVQGPVFEVNGTTAGQTGYMVTDGRQRVYVQSDMAYDYYSDYSAYSFLGGDRNVTEEQAAAAIDGFMKSHGLNFPYKIEDPHLNPGMYYALPLSPDGLPVYHDYNMPARLEFTVLENGQVTRVSSYQTKYEPAGTYGIRSAEEAFQQILDQSNGMENGVLEIMRSGIEAGAGFWSRTYPDNEAITIFGQPAYYLAAQPGQSPYLGIGTYTVSGNTAGLESADPANYVEAAGQFITESGIRKFQVDSWKVTDAAETYLSGSLRQDGDRIILTSEDGSGDYVIEDAPADLPLDTPQDSPAAVHGFLKNGQLSWDTIEYYPQGSGGGGGGGSGTGFYKLNLSGTPVPFDTPTSQPSSAPYEYTVVEGDTCGSIGQAFGVSIRSLISENHLSENCVITIGQILKIPGSSSAPSLVGQRIEGLRGILMVIIHKQADGGERMEYGLYPSPGGPFFYGLLQGEDIQKLQAYHNRPIDIWGTVTGVDQNGMPQVQVDRYEAPYPDLQFQNLTGTQKVAELEGERVALFTAGDGTTYVQLTSVGTPDITILGNEGDPVIMETLAIPGETFGGYPALRVFDGAMAVNPKDGQPTQFTGSADKFNIIDESVQPNMEEYIPPDLTIESVELVYYGPDPRMHRQDAGSGKTYLQPAWRFYGHYSDGSEVEFLVQALKQEFLLPELEPYTGPG
jgi:LysM repeat protein